MFCKTDIAWFPGLVCLLLAVPKFCTNFVPQATDTHGLGTRLRQIGVKDTIYGSHGLYVLFTAVLLCSNMWQ